MLPEKLNKKLTNRTKENNFRDINTVNNLIDFSSNDYLGLAKSEDLFHETNKFLIENSFMNNGATGSRLLTGSNILNTLLELQLEKNHNTKALLFNSGYNANTGLLGSILQRNDIIFYDEYSHASIRDGIKLSHAKSFSFKHNNLDNLNDKLERQSLPYNNSQVYVVTESVFSMDGDSPDLIQLLEICKKHNALLIVDEAHAIGVFGMGICQKLNIEKEVFARVITFGKALGVHGAAVLGSEQLISYLINFSKPFIYTTGLPNHTLAAIKTAYEFFLNNQKLNVLLSENISFFKSEVIRLNLQNYFKKSDSSIQSCIISNNNNVKYCSDKLKNKGFDVRPILSPTVPKGTERLRFCLHSYNTKEEIKTVLSILYQCLNSNNEKNTNIHNY